jgi:DNA-binding beta-propeller fold protein YncE
VYAPGETSALRVISDGTNAPVCLDFDGSGNLYVANQGANTVTEYAPNSDSVLRTLKSGISQPSALTL